MSNFKPSLTAVLLTATAATFAGTALAQDDANRASDAFNIADSNGDRSLDRSEFPTFISFLASGTTTSTGIASNATDYGIPFANKDKNGDGSLSAGELKIVVSNTSPYSADYSPPVTPEVETGTVQNYEQAPDPEPENEAPVVEVPVNVPVVAAPVPVTEPMVEPVQEPVIDAPFMEPIVESIVEPMLEETAPVPEIEEPTIEPLGEGIGETETPDPENQG